VLTNHRQGLQKDPPKQIQGEVELELSFSDIISTDRIDNKEIGAGLLLPKE
jgi:hypothetical protein